MSISEESKKKIIEFENSLDDLISEALDGASDEEIDEYFGGHPLGEVIREHREMYAELEKTLKKRLNVR